MGQWPREPEARRQALMSDDPDGRPIVRLGMPACGRGIKEREALSILVNNPSWTRTTLSSQPIRDGCRAKISLAILSSPSTGSIGRAKTSRR